jgi:hypothetical protein
MGTWEVLLIIDPDSVDVRSLGLPLDCAVGDTDVGSELDDGEREEEEDGAPELDVVVVFVAWLDAEVGRRVSAEGT